MKGPSFYCLDIAKFMMCFGVIAIHVSTLYPSYSTFEDILSHGAVPTFFVISGFLFGRNYLPSSREVRSAIATKYLKRLLLLYAVWALVYSVIDFCFLIHEPNTGTKLLLLVKDFICTGQFSCSWHLWYVHVLIVVVFLFHVLSRAGLRMWHLLLFSFLLYAIGKYINGSSSVFAQTYLDIFYSTENSFFFASSYVALGMCLSSFYNRLHNFVYVGLLVSGICFCLLNLPFFYHLSSVGIVGILVRWSHKENSISLANWMRRSSTFIYVAHMLPLLFLHDVLQWTANYYHAFVLVSLVTVILAFVWSFLVRFRSLSFLKKIS